MTFFFLRLVVNYLVWANNKGRSNMIRVIGQQKISAYTIPYLPLHLFPLSLEISVAHMYIYIYIMKREFRGYGFSSHFLFSFTRWGPLVRNLVCSKSIMPQLSASYIIPCAKAENFRHLYCSLNKPQSLNSSSFCFRHVYQLLLCVLTQQMLLIDTISADFVKINHCRGGNSVSKCCCRHSSFSGT